MTEPSIRIGELAARAEVSIRTVDYYTNLGLLTPTERTAGNYRLYAPVDAERIVLIKRLENQGISLEEIATAFTVEASEVATTLARLDDDLRTLHAAADVAPNAMQGLLAVIAGRVHTLVTIALQVPPDVPIL
ncbi:MerR family transcriptional regulator [Nocardia mangyaensis]|uniref:MerR family transcriptional regulator n=1 Tax=Nocardia mangyaensis TaxID=2213200 RepID=A0A1J0VUE5_9NOCA|nr:MerR family transcriptional regulator [Nocardia mangyaensis]APE35633.1 MerR family transcriptional regulator [Nocardia mangyaensis]